MTFKPPNGRQTVRVHRRIDRNQNVARAAVTSGGYSFLYLMDPSRSKLFHLPTDPGQQTDIINTGKEMHQRLLKLMQHCNVPQRLIDARLELKM